jgi:hypothetical protein
LDMAQCMAHSIIPWLRPWQVQHGVKWRPGARRHLVPAPAVFGQHGKNPENVGMPTTPSFGSVMKQIELGSC